MEILREIVQTEKPSAVALGFFDGVHTAHARVIRAVVGHENTVPTVLTFASDTNLPVSKVGYKLLQTEAQKAKCIEKLGIERLITLPFASVANNRLSRSSAKSPFFQAKRSWKKIPVRVARSCVLRKKFEIISRKKKRKDGAYP